MQTTDLEGNIQIAANPVAGFGGTAANPQTSAIASTNQEENTLDEPVSVTLVIILRHQLSC